MLISIKNENVSAAVETLGAELVSFVSQDGFEHIWQGDTKYWGGHAPVLFPIVGALRSNRTKINGLWYEMGRHGFARRREFTVVEQREDAVVLELCADEETKKVYPFDFRFTVSYILTGSSVTTEFKVENTGSEPLPYSVGGHPGFNLPIEKDEVFEDYDIVFEKPETQKCPAIHPTECLIDYDKTIFEMKNEDVIPLEHSLFYNDALVFSDLESTTITLKSRKSGRGVMMEFSGFPLFGIWSAANDGPYVALEPWTGCATAFNENDEFVEKRGLRTLNAGEAEKFAFTVFSI